MLSNIEKIEGLTELLENLCESMMDTPSGCKTCSLLNIDGTCAKELFYNEITEGDE